MSKSKSLSWCDRLALINHYKPTDEQAIKILSVTQDQLDTARDLSVTGAIVPTPNLDVDSYGKMFGITKPAVAKTTTSIVKPTSGLAPQTASKVSRPPKKRGRKGTHIQDAFANIPEIPVAVDQFAAEQKISVAVLRQSKRFNKFPEQGEVHVAKNKTTKVLEIWKTPIS